MIRLLMLSLLLVLPVTLAAEVDLGVTTPSIARLREHMTGRNLKVLEYKDAGRLGEGSDGLLAVRNTEGLKLAEKKELADLAAAENDDRRALYREILTANKLERASAERVTAAAAKSQRAASRPDHWIQRPDDGKWVKARDFKE